MRTMRTPPSEPTGDDSAPVETSLDQARRALAAAMASPYICELVDNWPLSEEQRTALAGLLVPYPKPSRRD